MLRVHFNRNAVAVVLDDDDPGQSIDRDRYALDVVAADTVIDRVHDDLVCDLVKARNVLQVFANHGARSHIDDEHGLDFGLDRPDVHAWTAEHMLALIKLFIRGCVCHVNAVWSVNVVSLYLFIPLYTSLYLFIPL